ncbi:hypothetical protein Hanom_Chr17g01533591 [Helianthus anomalus]
MQLKYCYIMPFLLIVYVQKRLKLKFLPSILFFYVHIKRFCLWGLLCAIYFIKKSFFKVS